MWFRGIKKDMLEAKLARVMGFEYCTLFDTARSALRALTRNGESWLPPFIPSNVCPLLRQIVPQAHLWPVHPETGMVKYLQVQLYGYRSLAAGYYLDLDPLMTGFLRQPIAAKSIISFGPKKMLDAGGGGALLSNEKFGGNAYFPEGLRGNIEWHLQSFGNFVELRRLAIDNWDRALGDSCVRIPQEQVMPWRVMRRIPGRRDDVVKAVRAAGHPIGTNYPPLPGVTDPGAIQWGKEVVNFFPDSDAAAVSEIVKRTLAQ